MTLHDLCEQVTADHVGYLEIYSFFLVLLDFWSELMLGRKALSRTRELEQRTQFAGYLQYFIRGFRDQICQIWQK